MKRILIIFLGLSTFFAGSSAFALRSGYNIRKKVNGRYVKAFKVTNKNYRYVKSRGKWRKIINIKTGKVYYVWHKAVTAKDRKRVSRIQNTITSTRKRKSLRKANFNVSKYGLRKNFNIRKSPNGRQLKDGRRRVTTTHDDFQMTGKFKYSSKGAKWYQVRNANGREGYVHQSALTKNKQLMPPPLPAPKQEVENFAKKESSYEDLLHKASFKTGKEDIASENKEIAQESKEKEELNEEIKPEAKKIDPKKIGFLSGYNIRSDKTTDSASLGLTDTNDFQPTGVSEIGSNGKDTWIQAKDSHGRTGWVHSDGATHRSDRLKDDSVSQESNDQISETTEGETSEKEEPVIEDKGASNVATLTKCQFQSPRIQKSCRSTCNFGKDKTRTNNCIKFHSMVARKKLPLNAALYSIKTWKQTTGKYCDGQSIKNKVRNKCSFMFANLDKGSSYRSPAYFVDLCAGNSKKSKLKDVVNFTTTKRGTGTGVRRSSARYTDRSGRKTTLAGVFRTGDLTAFDPFHKSRGSYRRRLGYRSGDRRCNDTWSKNTNYRGKTVGSWANKFKYKGKWVKNPFFKHCSTLRLAMRRIGGASTDDGKPMHTSPFNSSNGCPSVDKKDNWMVRKLAQGGVSLYIAYTDKRSEKKHFKKPAKQCKGDADAHNPLLAGKSF